MMQEKGNEPMTIQPIKTDRLTKACDIVHFLDQHIDQLPNSSVLAITSKIIAIAEGATKSIEETDKETLIQQEADYYLPNSTSQYGITLTIKDSILIPSAGIDESNSNGQYILWPRQVQQTVNTIRQHFQQRFNLDRFGVIITDSKTTPLRWGTTGVAIAHSGFKALNDYIGQPDIFNQPLRVTKANIMDGLAAAAVLIMGEGNEQTPLALITDIPFVSFTSENPTQEELDNLSISLDEDLYGPILQSVPWEKRG